MDDALYWLAATQLPGIGPLTLLRALTHFGKLSAVLSAKSSDLKAVGFTDRQCAAFQQADWRRADYIREWAVLNQCTLLTWADPAYPPLLREIHGAPLLLYIQGDAAVLSAPQLAMVGSREAGSLGCESAFRFARDLAKQGLSITSGLARGIDGASHRGALSAEGPGRTIAVLGTGLKHIYPAEHRGLAEKILAEGGAVVSELPPDSPPKASNFPLRNRLISGLAYGVLIVEAARRSGSLITARYALEQNREVFAMPGSIHNPRARGCHDLIRQGAKLVDSIQDILEELGVRTGALRAVGTSSVPVQALEPEVQTVLQQVDYAVTSRDVIIMRTGLTAAQVSSILLTLELLGQVKAAPGGYERMPVCEV